MKKKLIFFAHSNNDIDHYLPIIMENKVYEILIFFSPDGNTLDINSIHKKILSQKNVQILKIENFIKNPITKSIYFFLKKSSF